MPPIYMSVFPGGFLFQICFLFLTFNILDIVVTANQGRLGTIQYISDGKATVYLNEDIISNSYKTNQVETIKVSLKAGDYVGFKIEHDLEDTVNLMFKIVLANGNVILSGESGRFRVTIAQGQHLQNNRWVRRTYDYCHWSRPDTKRQISHLKSSLDSSGARFLSVRKSMDYGSVLLKGKFGAIDPCQPSITASTLSNKDKLFLMVNGRYHRMTMNAKTGARRLNMNIYAGDVISVLVSSNGSAYGLLVDVRMANGKRIVTKRGSQWRAWVNPKGFSMDISWSHPQYEVCSWMQAVEVNRGKSSVPLAFRLSEYGYIWASGGISGDNVQFRLTVGKDSCIPGVRFASNTPAQLFINGIQVAKVSGPHEIITYAVELKQGDVIGLLANRGEQEAFAVDILLPDGEHIATHSNCAWRSTWPSEALLKDDQWANPSQQWCHWSQVAGVSSQYTRAGGWPSGSPVDYVWDHRKGNLQRIVLFRFVIGGGGCPSCASGIRFAASSAILFINGKPVKQVKGGFSLGLYRGVLRTGDVVGIMAQGRKVDLGLIGTLQISDGRRSTIGSTGWRSIRANSSIRYSWLKKDFDQCKWNEMKPTPANARKSRGVAVIFGSDANLVWNPDTPFTSPIFVRYVVGADICSLRKAVQLASKTESNAWENSANSAESKDYCRCIQSAPPALPSKCWYFLGNNGNQCRYRPCEARYLCVHQGRIICMKKKVGILITPTVPGLCRNESISSQVLIPYHA